MLATFLVSLLTFILGFLIGSLMEAKAKLEIQEIAWNQLEKLVKGMEELAEAMLKHQKKEGQKK